MKQLLIISGKGGTGKTTIASALIELAGARAFADCDVDAPNLHLTRKVYNVANAIDFCSMEKAVINEDLCTSCGLCYEVCRFHAIHKQENAYKINTYACEGCAVCYEICPAKAIEMKTHVAGNIKSYVDRNIFTTAKLKIGSGTSGKLVSEVKKELKDQTIMKNIPFAIIDGSPGIGCPVIASLSGVDVALIVAEPTVSGISDMKRVIKIAEHFEVQVAICVNKYDINPHITKEIECLANKWTIPFVGKIPYDKQAVCAINSGIKITDIDSDMIKSINNMYVKLKNYI